MRIINEIILQHQGGSDMSSAMAFGMKLGIPTHNYSTIIIKANF